MRDAIRPKWGEPHAQSGESHAREVRPGAIFTRVRFAPRQFSRA